MKNFDRQILEQVNDFYEANPFPGFDLRKYSYTEDLPRQASWFGQMLDAQIPYNVSVLDAGCGTGQLSNFLSLKDRQVLGIDYSQKSLEYAHALKQRLGIRNASFRRMSLLDPELPNDSFDYVLCLGVLHHTSDPYRGLQNLVRVARPGGYLIIGLYNSLGRLPVQLRRQVKKIFHTSKIQQQAIQRQLVRQENDPEKTESWLADQYFHPHESTHSIAEVLSWFTATGVDYINSVPPVELFRSMKKNHRIMAKTEAASWRRSQVLGWLVQLKWLFSLRDNGGYFVMIGQKRK